MTYALDANVIIDYVNGESDVMIKFRNAVTSAMPMVITDIVDFEVVILSQSKQTQRSILCKNTPNMPHC